MNMPYPCDVDSCRHRATFASADLEVLACTRHARRGFFTAATMLAIALGEPQRTYWREGLGNLRPLSAFPDSTPSKVTDNAGYIGL